MYDHREWSGSSFYSETHLVAGWCIRMSTVFREISDPLWSGKLRLPSFLVDFDFPYPVSPRPDCSSTSKSLTLKTWKQMNWEGAPRCSSPKTVRCFLNFNSFTIALKVWIFLGVPDIPRLRMAWHHKKEQLGKLGLNDISLEGPVSVA